MIKDYQSGTYCRKTECQRHTVLENKRGEEYLRAKELHCGECHAWMFYKWLNGNSWRIELKIPEIPAVELAARIKGMDPALAADLTIEEILSL